MIYAILLPAICICLLILMYRNRHLPIFVNPKQVMGNLSTDQKYWRDILIILMVVGYLGMSVLLMLSWRQGDDWRNMFVGVKPLDMRIPLAFQTYSNRISRLGDLYIFLVGCTQTRWETFFVTPWLAISAPLLLFRLCKKQDDCIFSAKGVSFWIFIFFLCLLGVHNKGFWRNYRCWAAVVNYLVPTLSTIWLLAYYRIDQKKSTAPQSKISLFAIFIIGVVSGWGSECISAILVPVLILLLAFQWRKRIAAWRDQQYVGLLGVLAGATMLFASPALSGRAESARKTMVLKLSEMSDSARQYFLEHLDWAALGKLQLDASTYIGDFSFFEKMYFIPFLAKRFWKCGALGFITVAVLTLLVLFFAQKGKRRSITVALVTTAFAWLMAFSYMQGCIPGPMSFLPPCFITIAAASFLFLRFDGWKWIRHALVLGMAAYSLSILVPAGIEAWEYKGFEVKRWDNIQKQIASGAVDISLPKPYKKKPKDRLGLIAERDLSDKANKYPNVHAALALKVRSIKQQKP